MGLANFDVQILMTKKAEEYGGSNMKTKNLALTNGIVGIIGGIILLFGPIFVASSAISSVAHESVSSISGTSVFLFLVKIALLVLGIIGIYYYRGTGLVKNAPHVLLIVGGAVAIIPFLGWAGGIVAIVGGALYLASLKNFNQPNQPNAGQ